MSASEHINPFIKAYHVSWNTTPPHELEPSNLQTFQEHENRHPDILHMGTRRASMQIHRTHLHEYEIDPSALHPVVHGDSPAMLEVASSKVPSYKTREIKEKMAGVQPELWESLPGDPREAVGTGKVFPYRNLAEDVGSISFMVPKSAIASGAVRYKGVTDLDAKDESGRTTRDKIEEEEGMYRYERKV